MKITTAIKSYVLYAIFPDKCVCCGRIVAKGKQICPACAEHIECFEAEKRCLQCGLVRKRCRCKNRVYHFSGLIAPFYNAGLAKRGFYKYKLGKREHFADFFASAMALSVRSEYGNIKFDGICGVPPSRGRKRKFGYNPPDQLGRIISERLGIPYIENALGCRNIKSAQHKAKGKERFSAVKGRYFPRKPLKNMKILLVDDISTTGATLDECSRQLLRAGAYEVWCVSALITDRDYRIESDYTAEILRQDGIAIEK